MNPDDEPQTHVIADQEAEMAVLGAVIGDGELIKRLPLVEADFWNIRHRAVWNALGALVRGKIAIDLVTVMDELKRHGQLEMVGGLPYLMRIVTNCPNFYHAEDYARIVKDKAQRRQTVAVASELAKAGYDAGSDLVTAFADSREKLAKTISRVADDDGLRQAISDVYDDDMQRMADPRDIYGLATGFSEFDSLTHGLQRKEMVVLSGEPGAGKSLLASQMAAGMAVHTPGKYYSLEMSKKAIVRRLISGRAKIPTAVMLSGKMTAENLAAYAEAIEYFENLPMRISEESRWTTAEMRTDLEALKADGVGWFVVDYLALMADDYGKDANERSAYVSQQIHSIAKDLDMAALVIHSMNKIGMAAETPDKSTLSGSGRVAYDADQIIFMKRKNDNPTNNVVCLTWDKVREGDSNRRCEMVRLPGLPVFQTLLKETRR